MINKNMANTLSNTLPPFEVDKFSQRPAQSDYCTFHQWARRSSSLILAHVAESRSSISSSGLSSPGENQREGGGIREKGVTEDGNKGEGDPWGAGSCDSSNASSKSSELEEPLGNLRWSGNASDEGSGSEAERSSPSGDGLLGALIHPVYRTWEFQPRMKPADPRSRPCRGLLEVFPG